MTIRIKSEYCIITDLKTLMITVLPVMGPVVIPQNVFSITGGSWRCGSDASVFPGNIHSVPMPESKSVRNADIYIFPVLKRPHCKGLLMGKLVPILNQQSLVRIFRDL